MESSVLLCLLITQILLTLLLAGFAVAAWSRASASTRRSKQPASPPQTPPSEIHLATLAADQAELFSTLGKLTTTVKRLSSRQGMQDVRDRRATAEAPALGTSKAELLKHYGLSGATGPTFYQRQMGFEQQQGASN